MTIKQLLRKLLKREWFRKYLFHNRAFLFLKSFFIITGVSIIIVTLIYTPLRINNKNFIPNTNADSGFQIKTGYYLGTGSSQNINIGFQPELVLIKGSTTAGSVLKTTAMTTESLSFLTIVPGASNTNNQLSFINNGFSVETNNALNKSGVIYTYIAMVGSNCTSSGVFCVGSYVGDGTSSRPIISEFSPDLIWVTSPTDFEGNFRTSEMADNEGAYFRAGATNKTGILFKTLQANSFTVGLTNNALNTQYNFVVFNKSLGGLEVGSYTGNGVAGREISGLGFAPRFVFTKRLSTSNPIFTIDELSGTVLSLNQDATSVGISELTDDGFTLTNSLYSNGINTKYIWFAFGSKQTFEMKEEPFTMKTGSYTGNGSVQTITNIGFDPDLIFVKSHDVDSLGSVFKTSLDIDSNSFSVGYNANSLTSGITQLGPDSFSVGSDASVNSLNVTYEYVAFGNATTPYKKGSDSFIMGLYTGNSQFSRKISTVGKFNFFATKKRNNTTEAVFKTSVMDDNTSAFFSNVANNTNGAYIKNFVSDGILLNNNTRINQLDSEYVWFAFKESQFFKVGSYIGDGISDKEINTVGFKSDWIFIKKSTNSSGVHRSSSVTLLGDISQYFIGINNGTDLIKSFLANGFSLGSSAYVNANSGLYNYVAWKKPDNSSGTLNVSIVDTSENEVINPIMEMSLIGYSSNNQVSTGQLGTVNQKIRISNTTNSTAWSVSLAALDGPNSLWGSDLEIYDFNDPASDVNDGGDIDGVGGQMSVDSSGGVITPQTGCSLSGINLGGSSYFSEGVYDSVTLVSASSGAGTNCYWDLSNILIQQTIPKDQAVGSYELPMVITIVAS